MRTRKALLVGFLFCLGCGPGLRMGTPAQLRETDEPQTAVFYTARGWTGGMGQPVLDASQHLVQVQGLPVYLDPDAERTIQARGKLPGCVTGQERILVKARARLERRSGANHSVPGAPSVSYYALVVEELLDVAWDGTPCAEK